MALPDPEEALSSLRRPDDEDETPANELPDTKVIDLDVTDSRGTRYRGSFLYTVPTLGDQIEIGKLKTHYLPQGSAADPEAALLVEVIAYLTVCLTFNELHKKPSWWKPLQARTPDPYSKLYGRCLEYEARFHGRGQDHRADEGDDAGPGEPEPDSELRVGGEVRPPAKRRETLAGDGS